jgi:hypothetical protein
MRAECPQPASCPSGPSLQPRSSATMGPPSCPGSPRSRPVHPYERSRPRRNEGDAHAEKRFPRLCGDDPLRAARRGQPKMHGRGGRQRDCRAPGLCHGHRVCRTGDDPSAIFCNPAGVALLTENRAFGSRFQRVDILLRPILQGMARLHPAKRSAGEPE